MANFVDRLITSGTIAVGKEVRDWEDAVRTGGLMMVNAGMVNNNYVEAIIANHKEIGPYFVIAPGIAMPHAKPENGVLKTGYALITLKKPVLFGDKENDPVDILIFAGAINREEHNQEVIPQVAELCDSEKYIDALRKADSKSGVEKVLKEFAAELESGELD